MIRQPSARPAASHADPARLPAARRGVRADRGRPHAGHLRGQRRGPGAAVPAQHREGLGDSRVRHAAAGHHDPHKTREASTGKVGGRTQEIQRLIGRALRSITKLEALGERTIWIDCDVIQADGGTRTASITGAFVALVLAAAHLRDRQLVQTMPVQDYIAATSVGIVDEVRMLDLAYDEDSRAQVDMNVVKTGDGRYVEVQGTAEALPFGRDGLLAMLDLADSGIRQLIDLQREIVGPILK